MVFKIQFLCVGVWDKIMEWAKICRDIHTFKKKYKEPIKSQYRGSVGSVEYHRGVYDYE